MPKLRVLSGGEVIKILNHFGFAGSSHRGSHVKLCRTISNIRQTLTIPNHPELDRGTLRAIYNQACRYLPADQLQSYFYH